MKSFRLTAADGTRQVFTVDDDVVDLVKSRRWRIQARPQALTVAYRVKTKIGDSWVPLEQLIMGPPPQGGLIIDHIDRNPLNNIRANFRWATQSQNIANRGKRNTRLPYKGICKTVKGKYRATISNREKGIRRMKTFNTPREAAVWYDEQAREVHGQFACTNEMLGLLNDSKK